MYDDLHTAGVLPSCAAVSFTAATMSFFRSVRPGTLSPSSRASAHAAIDGAPQLGQGAAEGDQPVVLLLLAFADGGVVVAVLPAAFLVAADGLQLRPRVAGDGDVFPGRRQLQGADPLQLLACGSRIA